MIVCVCNRISDREIHAAVELGADSVHALREHLGVGSCCGRCMDCAALEVERARQATRVAEAA